jgi:hypothetical protein
MERLPDRTCDCQPRPGAAVPRRTAATLLGWVLFAAAGIAGTAAGVAAQGNPLEGTIRGRVVDNLTAAPIADVRIEVLDGKDRIRRVSVSDADGNFLLHRVAPGPFWLRGRHGGYAPTKTPAWRIEGGDVLSVTIYMDPHVVLLAPLEVHARARTFQPMLAGFRERVQRRQGGTYLTRGDIEARNPARLTDLLESVPGLRVQPATGAANSRLITFARALPGLGGGPAGCPVQVYVDGILASRGRATVPLDELAVPGALEGVEIYRGLGTVPAEFLTPEARCGVIALWTRRTHELP